MKKNKTPVGDMTLVGAVAYQLYSRIYYGQVEYFAEVGRPYRDKTTGRTAIIPQLKASAINDYRVAVDQAASKLEELRSAQFKQTIAHDAQAITPLAAGSELAVDAPTEEHQEPQSLKLA